MMIKNKYNFFFFFCRTGWRFRLPRSLSSQNRIRFTLQTPTVLRQTLIMLSVRSESFRFFSNRTELLSFVVSCMSILINAFQIVFFFQDIYFRKVYQNIPNVFVSANHSSAGGNLDPMHNSITAWVEVRNLCMPLHIL